MSGIHRFLTRRERSSRHGNKEDTSVFLSRPHLRSFFSSQSSSGDISEQQKKVKIIQRRISQLGITGIKEEHMAYALQSPHAQGDVDKAFDLLLLLEDSIEGIVRGYTPSTKLLGAENREMVTCYLDALLFAMFARFDCFEPILYKTFNDEPRRDLAILLRFWVNMLRSGRLITTDITKHLQDALAKCGWKDAAELRQQDASEAFTFITEKLELPLLTLKMDIYHTGKEDERDDHKFVNERLLEIAIPEPSDGKTVTLEDCLENYFNNRIEVKRFLERRNTTGSTRSLDSLCKGVSAHIETVEVSPSPTASPTSLSPTRLDELQPISSVTQSGDKSPSRKRRDSIVQERFVPDPEGEEVAGDSNSQRRGSYRKEVMMPAWQFFSLIPWYTDNTPKNDAQIATHFSTKRPMLGMCLKRYSMTPEGRAIRLNTFVDIPTEIGLPHFIQDDSMDEEGPIYGNFKLSLQAMVCHRGNSVDSGHYISIVRGTNAGVFPPSSRSSQSTASDPPQYWMRFDDLAKERVTLVDIEQALKHESPYLLFYQILPINEDAGMVNLPQNRISSSESEPRELNLTEASQGSATDFLDSERVDGARSNRPSFEITGPDNEELGPLDTRGRKFSVGFSEVADLSYNPGWSQIHSVPSTSPKLAPEADGRSSFSFSRRGSRTTRSNPGSRAGSQASESRFSLPFSRFTGRLNREKPNSDETSAEGDDEVAVEADTREDQSAPMNSEMKDNSARRLKEDAKQKGKFKPRERIGRKLERECVVM